MRQLRAFCSWERWTLGEFMTALTVSSAGSGDFGAIAERLDALGNRMRLANVVRGLARLLTIAVPATIAGLFLIGFFSLPAGVNIAVVLVIAGVWVAAYVRMLHRAVFVQPTYAEIARRVEEEAAEAGMPVNNELINAVLLANDFADGKGKGKAGGAWIPQVLQELNLRTAELPLEQAIRWRGPRNAALLAVLIAVPCVVAMVAFPGVFEHGMRVLFHPASFVPMQGEVKIVSVEPGNDTLLAGQSVNFAVTTEALPAQHARVDATLSLAFASGKSASTPMTPFGVEGTQYQYQMAAVAEDVDYVVSVGRTQSERFHLTVLPQIHLLQLKLDATPPAYTHKEPVSLEVAGKDATGQKGSIEVPLGSSLNLSLMLDIPAKEVLLDVAGGSPIALAASSDGKTFGTSMVVKNSFKYAIRVNDRANRTLRRFPDSDNATEDAVDAYALTATPDDPPTVAVTEPGKDIDATPGDHVRLAAQANDDYGLTGVTLEIAKNEAKEFRVAQSWPLKAGTDGKPVLASTIHALLEVPATDYKLGDTLRYRFVATDNRDLTQLDATWGPQATAGQVFTINFNDTAAAAAKSTKLWEELRKQLTALLDRQVALRKQSNDLTSTVTLGQMQKITTPIAQGQTSLRTDMAALAKDFPFEPTMKLIQKSLQVLVVEDATGAVDRGSDILLLSDTKAMVPLATKLRQHQSRIIDVLQTLLAIAASDEHHATVAADHDGEDLPNEARDAWKKLAEDMKKFEKDQKAVIDSTADLAKKPKDEYDQNDAKKLSDLSAVEDKWEKFLNNRLVDMSKIAEQDQANASLLDEMVQMKVELAAAKNALDQKATQIATPLEENGLENAKALDTHIERMLAAAPDHTQWQMEEPVTQNDPAMAELPKQLQDMVGDLMDKEEDLTEDMESTASKFADSLNKGAGWDAADGPISNMSAQGVTGNQLPKNDEIQGRSGEGREGRSSGEFVGAEAEGKGGRRTPTRMTNDPFSAGQVKDNSKEPAGGATGGGKKGGFGGEGLEGQAPLEADNPTQRLQGAQAALRNGAERLSLQMHAAGFDNFKLLEANVLMRKSEEALKAFHYQTALYYQQEAVQSLNTAKVLAAGQMHVVADTTPEVSEKTEKEMETALNGVMPKGYGDPVKAYFEKLSAGEGAPQN
jgi:hypothetical protein